MNIIHSLFIVYLLPDLSQFDSSFSLYEYSVLTALIIDQSSIIDTIVQSMLSYCSLFLIPEMYSRYFDPTTGKLNPLLTTIYESINIIQEQESPTFILA